MRLVYRLDMENQVKYTLKVQAIRPKGQTPKLYVYFPIPLAEVIEEVRALPRMKESLWMFLYFTVLFVAGGALLMGILIAKLFL